jgi:hypothetical protein
MTKEEKEQYRWRAAIAMCPAFVGRGLGLADCIDGAISYSHGLIDALETSAPERCSHTSKTHTNKNEDIWICNECNQILRGIRHPVPDMLDSDD